jgi:predicted anti-sigma-YlaC factor YlaD
MMTCAEARAALLVADLEAMRAGAPGEVGAHLTGCPDCRATANRIVAGTAALAVARAGARRQPSASVAAVALANGQARRAWHRRIRTLVPLLAAASLAVFIVQRTPTGAPDPRPPAPPFAEAPPLVEAGGQTVAVFSTTRPDITVVWQF